MGEASEERQTRATGEDASRVSGAPRSLRSPLPSLS